MTYSYDASGQRVSKTVNGVTTEFYYDDRGVLVLSSRSDGTELRFYADAEGNIDSFSYNNEQYYYVRNAQNDVIGITDKNGAFVARYTYDEWGNITAITDGNGVDVSTNPNHIANINPLRYRSYFYDAETGFYYVTTRYYDPAIGRFINADSVSCIGANTDLASYNIFAYCGNNPVNRKDIGGFFWDAVFDVVSICFSVVEVIQNPTDPMAWAELGADVLSLAVPGVTGGGAMVRAATKADDVVDAIKAVDKVSDIADTTHDLAKAGTSISKQTKQLRSSAVRQAWKNEVALVESTGKGTRNWTIFEIDELLTTGKVKGYQGHHMKSVKGYPELAGDSYNIQFLTRKEHLAAHNGNWRNITHGRYIP